MNKHRKVYYVNRLVADMRLHIFMVTISGFGKSFTLNQFLSRYGGILSGSKIEVGKIASLTSAGLVGSIKSTQDGQTVIHKGVLQRKNNYILGCEEFTNITASQRTSHSSNLIDDILIALDTGEMNKEQSGGGLEYDTFATVWAATQPGRFELKSGLPRRFCFVIYMPDARDVEKFNDNMEEAENIPSDINAILKLREHLDARLIEINNIKSIKFDKEFYIWMKSNFSIHFEKILYKRIVLGYWLMKLEKVGDNLVLGLNDEVKAIVMQQIEARLHVQKGVDRIKIMEVLKYKKTIPYNQLEKILLSLSLEEKYINRDIAALIANKIITIENGIVTNLIYDESGTNN